MPYKSQLSAKDHCAKAGAWKGVWPPGRPLMRGRLPGGAPRPARDRAHSPAHGVRRSVSVLLLLLPSVSSADFPAGGRGLLSASTERPGSAAGLPGRGPPSRLPPGA